MIGEPKTREQIQEETGLKGKELTTYLRTILAGGGTSSASLMSILPVAQGA